MRLWARAYPKVEVFDGTAYQVKGLRQVVIEALEKHTDLLSQQRLALVEGLVAYIAWWGDGQSIDPGHSRALPPAVEDLIELQSSVERGGRLFYEDILGPCVRCHDSGERGSAPAKIPVVRAATTFPHYVHPPGRVMSMEAFLSWHIATNGKEGYTPESSVVTDLAAYLVSLAKGKRLYPGGWEKASGDQYYD
jgi:cytochrome c